MTVLRFRDATVRRACCDPAQMQASWGPAIARQISRRLQQLEAMSTIADLSFLPFDSHEHDGGVIEIAVADHVAIYIKQEPATSEGDELMDTIDVLELGTRTTAAWSS